jgi:glycosyltransferase involved in cell wall biosynthesis
MEEKYNLGFFLPSLAGGGAEKTMITLANEFSSRGHTVDLLLGKAEGPYKDKVSDDVRIIDFDAPELPGFALSSSIPYIIKYIKLKQPDVIISALFPANLVNIIATKISNTDTISIISEQNRLSRHLEHTSSKERLTLPSLIRFIYPKSDVVTAVSQGVASDLSTISGIPQEQIEIAHNASMDPDIEHLATEDVDHKFFDTGYPVIIAVGNLTKQKDFETLLRSFAKVQENKQSRLIILGEGEKREELEQLRHRLGLDDMVDLPGFVNNPYAYLQQSSLFVLSSKWEGLPTVVIEALACGCPIVSTDCPSGPSEILKDGEYGTLIPVGDDKEMSTAILRMLEDPTPSDKLKERANDFSTEAAAERYLELIQKHTTSIES